MKEDILWGDIRKKITCAPEKATRLMETIDKV